MNNKINVIDLQVAIVNMNTKREFKQIQNIIMDNIPILDLFEFIIEPYAHIESDCFMRNHKKLIDDVYSEERM